MGKHETGYRRMERDFYPTREAWVTEALTSHLKIAAEAVVWEPAAGRDAVMAHQLRAAAGVTVMCSDVEEVKAWQPSVRHNFIRAELPQGWGKVSGIITNPPFGSRGKMAERFIGAGLKHLERGEAAMLALLLPSDFDSAGGRRRFFADCPRFSAKITLTKRITWFQRTDGIRPAPKENHCWCVWTRADRPWGPLLLYGP